MFVCAVLVLNGFEAYNIEKKYAESDIEEVKTELTNKEALPDTTSGEKEAAAEISGNIQETEKKSTVSAAKAQTPSPKAEAKASSLEIADPSANSLETAEDTFIQEDSAVNSRSAGGSAYANIPMASAYSMQDSVEDVNLTVSMTGELFKLFNEDFDYKTAITEKIKAQSPPEDFEGISGYESYCFSADGALIITIYDKDGKEYNFEVGYIENGELKG